jgi:hypothetical protein
MMLFVWGALTMACFVTGLVLLKFWRMTRDRFFLLFALAFWLFALNWIVLALAHPSDENRHWLYVVRLPTFLLIVLAILDKNRRAEG